MALRLYKAATSSGEELQVVASSKDIAILALQELFPSHKILRVFLEGDW